MSKIGDSSVIAREVTTHAASANSVVRSILKNWGKQQDRKTGQPGLGIDSLRSILKHFEYKCVYCDQQFEMAKDEVKGGFVWDHVIPMNKESGGLHVYGNLVPACQKCNAAKLNKSWESFLMDGPLSDEKKTEFHKRIKTYMDSVNNAKAIPPELIKELQETYLEIANTSRDAINTWRKRAEKQK